MLPVVVSLSSDPTPNIRFNVAKTLERIIPLVSATNPAVVSGEIKTTLDKLVKDGDMDVQFFAKQALASTNIAFSSLACLTNHRALQLLPLKQTSGDDGN